MTSHTSSSLSRYTICTPPTYGRRADQTNTASMDSRPALFSDVTSDDRLRCHGLGSRCDGTSVLEGRRPSLAANEEPGEGDHDKIRRRPSCFAPEVVAELGATSSAACHDTIRSRGPGCSSRLASPQRRLRSFGQTRWPPARGRLVLAVEQQRIALRAWRRDVALSHAAVGQASAM
jgi:hypothetical protein